jgi:hypothetical protein
MSARINRRLDRLARRVIEEQRAASGRVDIDRAVARMNALLSDEERAFLLRKAVQVDREE